MPASIMFLTTVRPEIHAERDRKLKTARQQVGASGPRRSHRLLGILFPGKGARKPLLTANGSATMTCCPALLYVCEKSPDNCAAVGTDVVRALARRWLNPSKLKKKKVLFRP